MQIIKLYTTNCPKCNILKAKLAEKNVDFEICNDVDLMINLGFKSSPMLEVDGKILNYLESINWLKEI